MTPRIALIIALLLALPGVSFAAPAVTNVSGTLTHESTVTVTGSGFGTKTQAAPVVWDVTGNIPSYSGLSDGDTIPVGPGYPFTYNGASAVKYITTDLRHPHVSAMYSSRPTSVDIANIFSRSTPIGGDNFYISWWARPSGGITDNQSTKVLRLSDDPGMGTLEVSWTGSQLIYYDTNGGYRMNVWTGWDGVVGEWNRTELWWHGDSVTAWVNGSQRINARLEVDPMNGDNTPWSAPRPVNYIYHLGYDPNTASAGLIQMDFSEIYIDDTPARVEVCDGISWGSRGDCEVQYPETWGEASVSISVNQGALLTGTAYLYVVDSTGAVNETGYPVTVGGTPDTTPPSSPLNLSVQ